MTQTFNVIAASQTISFPAIASFTWNGGSATLSATATSGLAVAYSIISGPCAASGGNQARSGGAGKAARASVSRRRSRT